MPPQAKQTEREKADAREAAKKQLRERQVRLTVLAQHPAWQELRDEFARQKERHLKKVAGELMGTALIDQREIDYYRGFWAGCGWLLNTAENAEDALEKALNRAKQHEEERLG